METKDITALVKGLNQDEVQTLISELRNQDKAYIPQWYLQEHAVYYGYKNLKEMRKLNSYLYEEIDELMRKF